MKNFCFGVATFCFLSGLFIYMREAHKPLPPLKIVVHADEPLAVPDDPIPVLPEADEPKAEPCMAVPEVPDSANSELDGQSLDKLS